MQIQIAKSDEDVLTTYPVVRQLRPDLDAPQQYLRTIRLLEQEQGTLVAVGRNAERAISVALFRFCRNLGWGKYLYLDDLVTDEAVRSTGAGRAMFLWLKALALQHGCREFRLDSAVSRHAAHRFYLRERMDIVAFHFRSLLM